MKKVIMLLAVLSMALSSYAQFEKGKYYVGASLTGLDLSYSGTEDFNVGLEAKAGYLLDDDWMLTAQLAFQHSGDDDVADSYSIGIGGRYYIIQNGLYLGVNAKLLHASHNHNDLMPGIEVGYAFFINRNITIEPAVYYDQSFKNHSDYSKIGFRIGIGVYL
ncbi:MAG: outer membrane beta-barrel protein [Prevotellaceae bacterium]|nr:outer membrane beta-barrel protein [Prevotellaceae bacterium]